MIKAEIIADSINPKNCRITSWVLEFPRFVHSELMTHRVFSKNAASCLAGDTIVTVEKPSVLKRGGKSKHTNMTIKEIVDKWFDGDSLNKDMKFRIKNMNLRCFDEEKGDFITTNIINCFKSGVKPIYEIELENGYKLKCTKEHRILGEDGWFTLNDLKLTQTAFGIAWKKKSPEVITNGINITVEEVLLLKGQGLNLTAISEVKGIPFKSLSSFCERNKIIFKKKAVPNENLIYKNREWLEERLNKGLFAHQIAAICNSTTDRIKKTVKKLGLKGNQWHWGMKQTWNKGLTYKLPDSSLVKVREHAKTRITPDSHKKYKDHNIAITRFLTGIRKEILEKYNWKCQCTGSSANLQLHHIDPVWHNKDLSFDKNNIIPINAKIHKFIHSNNLDLEFLSWYQSEKLLKNFISEHKDSKILAEEIGKPIGKGNTLIAKKSKIKSIKFIGNEETYDLEVQGQYHNFIANGIVVHNSRAIPIEKMIQQVIDNPAMPVWWGKNQSGMQAKEELDNIIQVDRKELDVITTDMEQAKVEWIYARNKAIGSVKSLSKLGLHKQIANRILEPWFNIRVILTGTDFENWFALRAHPDAQPEIRVLAEQMLELYNASEPNSLNVGEWHIPFGDKIDNDRVFKLINFENIGNEDVIPELIEKYKLKIATARCARISYFNFEGKDDYSKDVETCDKLFGNIPRHLSPAEHPAQCMNDESYYGNFRGFKQYRKFFSEENLTDSRVIKKYWKK